LAGFVVAISSWRQSQNGRPDPLWLRDTADVFHFEHVGDVLYVQINQVKDDNSETFAHFAGLSSSRKRYTNHANYRVVLTLGSSSSGV
jgi:hypothetical protein